MNVHVTPPTGGYGILVEPLAGTVRVYRNGILLAETQAAKVMYETRLPPTVYFPREDIQVPLSDRVGRQTFCPFKGTACYHDLNLQEERVDNAVWIYNDTLPEASGITGHVGFVQDDKTHIDLGENTLTPPDHGNISGPLINWILRDAAMLPTPEGFTAALADKLREQGVHLTRLSVLSWSLHPMIAGKNYVWKRSTGEITVTAPSYDILSTPEYQTSPLRHVSQGLGGVRHRLHRDLPDDAFPILRDLRKDGATDYVAMPLPFSDGRINVMTLASDHPDGFSTANLGLIFECSAVIARYYEVFMQRENAQSLLETYVGKRSGARVLGGEIRRGDGDEIDAAIMFCDLRNSTRLEEDLGRRAYIQLLNGFFERVSTIVHDNGGEVLKFIGDAVLAVFPADPQKSFRARNQALRSARAIVDALPDLAAETGLDTLLCSTGLAYGSVTYGNVGSQERLDFTVIGQAANVAARLGDYGKSLSHQIVVSADVLKDPSTAIPLGEVDLHGVSRPVTSYAIPTD